MTTPDLDRVEVTLTTCRALLAMRDDASRLQLAAQLVQRLADLDQTSTGRLLGRLEVDFGPSREHLEKALADVDLGVPASVQRLHRASTSARHRLFEAINVAPGGTEAIVQLRAVSLALDPNDHPATADDLETTLRSWFNRGFLTLERIGWQTPASVLEKLIEYEAVHEITSWADLRRRLDRDRRCFGFFHPSLPGEPVIFVQVALTRGMPDSIQTLLGSPAPQDGEIGADTATFYSISNCQVGLRGISFGSLLLKQVTEALRAELPQLSVFVTLSPLPGLRAWMDDHGLTPDPAELARHAARYLLEATRSDRPLDPVARFHLRNGARIERINIDGDTSPHGSAQSYGVMVNYRYDHATLVANHEAYTNSGTIAIGPEVEALI